MNAAALFLTANSPQSVSSPSDQFSKSALIDNVRSKFFLLKNQTRSRICEQFAHLQTTQEKDVNKMFLSKHKPPSFQTTETVIVSQPKSQQKGNVANMRSPNKSKSPMKLAPRKDSHDLKTRTFVSMRSIVSGIGEQHENGSKWSESNVLKDGAVCSKSMFRLSPSNSHKLQREKTPNRQPAVTNQMTSQQYNPASPQTSKQQHFQSDRINTTVELSECFGLDFSSKRMSGSKQEPGFSDGWDSCLSSIKRNSIDSSHRMLQHETEQQPGSERALAKIAEKLAFLPEQSTKYDTDDSSEAHERDFISAKIKNLCRQALILALEEASERKQKQRNFKKKAVK